MKNTPIVAIIISLVSAAIGSAGLILGAIAISKISSTEENSEVSQPGLESFEDFVGTWKVNGVSVLLGGPYNSDAEDITPIRGDVVMNMAIPHPIRTLRSD